MKIQSLNKITRIAIAIKNESVLKNAIFFKDSKLKINVDGKFTMITSKTSMSNDHNTLENELFT